ncbi:TetR/AcrR family transcriptional regulator [Streptomyces sp. NPDC056529]|uniref:TetR/AcrR family transcriptional regulator n=1 Tax=Streptomyces sp. NPDC056529 TaxID=3345855 RepID=UPI00368C735D
MAKNSGRNEGRTDPGRTLALLWRDYHGPARNARGPKQGLTVDRIVDAAIHLADEEGLAALSMRKVAEPLGVSTMSLYTYVNGRAELVNCMFDKILSESPSLDGVEDGWRAALERYARGAHDIALRHPWVPPLMSSRMLMGPHETAVWDGVLRAVSGTGLDERDMLAVVNLVNGYVRGAALQDADSRQDERRGGLSHQEWFERTGPELERLIPFTRFPTLTRVWMTGVFEEPGSGFGADGGFEFGLQRVLDGVERYVDRCAADRAEGGREEGGRADLRDPSSPAADAGTTTGRDVSSG